jgi:hypothetical protein
MSPRIECVEIWHLISVSINGELKREEGLRVIHHIENCPEEDCDICKRLLEDFYEIRANVIRRKKGISIELKKKVFARIRELTEND